MCRYEEIILLCNWPLYLLWCTLGTRFAAFQATDGLKAMDGLPSDARAMLRADGLSLLEDLGITLQIVEHSRAEAKRRVVENAKALAPRLFDDSRKPAKHLRLPAAWFGLNNPDRAARTANSG